MSNVANPVRLTIAQLLSVTLQSPSESCYGECINIDFIEMLHGESLERMDKTEKLLCKTIPDQRDN